MPGQGRLRASEALEIPATPGRVRTVTAMETMLPIVAALLSALSLALPLFGFLSLFILAETWRGPGEGRRSWFLQVYKATRFYVFAVLILANLWLLAGVLVINTDFWSLYDAGAGVDPGTALEEALEHWDELQ